jgi:hypothetical protein
MASDECRGRILSCRARGADTQAVHGPLQRLLGVMRVICSAAVMTLGTRSRSLPASR